MTVDQPTDEDRTQSSPKNIEKMWKFVEHFANKSGSYLHPQREITEFLVIGLAKHVDDLLDVVHDLRQVGQQRLLIVGPEAR